MVLRHPVADLPGLLVGRPGFRGQHLRTLADEGRWAGAVAGHGAGGPGYGPLVAFDPVGRSFYACFSSPPATSGDLRRFSQKAKGQKSPIVIGLLTKRQKKPTPTPRGAGLSTLIRDQPSRKRAKSGFVRPWTHHRLARLAFPALSSGPARGFFAAFDRSGLHRQTGEKSTPAPLYIPRRPQRSLRQRLLPGGAAAGQVPAG